MTGGYGVVLGLAAGLSVGGEHGAAVAMIAASLFGSAGWLWDWHHKQNS
jgi:hypothetical protein